MNQFYRLKYNATTKLYEKTTRWNHSHVISGHVVNFDGSDCMVCAGAVALDAQTNGAVRATPANIHDHQDDWSGGIGVDDVDVAWHRFANQDLLTPANATYKDVEGWIREERRHVILGVDHDYIPMAQRTQKTGSFDHAFNLDDLDGPSVYRYDSLDTNARWAPFLAFKAGAEALANRVRGDRGQLFVGLTKSRPALTAGLLVQVSPIPPKKTRDFGLYTVAGSHVVSARVATTGGFSAKGIDHDTYTWAGHSDQDLVILDSGGLADRARLLGVKYGVRGAYIKEV